MQATNERNLDKITTPHFSAHARSTLSTKIKIFHARVYWYECVYKQRRTESQFPIITKTENCAQKRRIIMEYRSYFQNYMNKRPLKQTQKPINKTQKAWFWLKLLCEAFVLIPRMPHFRYSESGKSIIVHHPLLGMRRLYLMLTLCSNFKDVK